MVPHINLLEAPGKRGCLHVQRSSTTRAPNHLMSLALRLPHIVKRKSATLIFSSVLMGWAPPFSWRILRSNVIPRNTKRDPLIGRHHTVCCLHPLPLRCCTTRRSCARAAFVAQPLSWPAADPPSQHVYSASTCPSPAPSAIRPPRPVPHRPQAPSLRQVLPRPYRPTQRQRLRSRAPPRVVGETGTGHTRGIDGRAWGYAAHHGGLKLVIPLACDLFEPITTGWSQVAR